MHTPVEDSHEVAQQSKLGAPLKLGTPVLAEEPQRLYLSQEMVVKILQDLYARHHRILVHYLASPLASGEAFTQCMKAAEFDVAIAAMADLGEWLEQFQLTIYAHLKNVWDVPLGAEPLPLPPPPPAYHVEGQPDGK